MADKIRVLIADRHELFREGLCCLLKHTKDIECIGQATNSQQTVDHTKELAPDTVIMDVEMASIGIPDVIKHLRRVCPSCRILLLTHSTNQAGIVAAMEGGIDGYLIKDIGLQELLNTIRIVQRGEVVFSGGVAKNVMGLAAQPARQGYLVEGLHDREKEVLKLVARGMSNKEVAMRLGLSIHTVGIHLGNVLKKLEATSRTEAVAHGLSKGVINIDDLTTD